MLPRLDMVFWCAGATMWPCWHCPGNREKALLWRLPYKGLLVAIGHLETTCKLQMVEMWYVGSM